MLPFLAAQHTEYGVLQTKERWMDQHRTLSSTNAVEPIVQASEPLRNELNSRLGKELASRSAARHPSKPTAT